jgi:hypothetical protein
VSVSPERLGGAEAGVVVQFPLERIARKRARRRRAAVRRRALGFVVVAAASIGLARLGPESPAVRSMAHAPGTVVVHAGETLWDLAGRYAPSRVDPRSYVDAVVRRNHLTGPLYPGERLRLPK